MKNAALGFTTAAFPLLLLSIAAPDIAQAQSASVLACVKTMQDEFKVSGDVAFSECNKKALIDCIKMIADRNYVAESIRREGSGYLIDLGGDDARWLEGGAWKSLGCEPHIPGPQRITQTVSSWNTNKHQWFRQGVCKTDFVELDQPIGKPLAKFYCETDSVPQRLIDVPKTL